MKRSALNKLPIWFFLVIPGVSCSISAARVIVSMESQNLDSMTTSEDASEEESSSESQSDSYESDLDGPETPPADPSTGQPTSKLSDTKSEIEKAGAEYDARSGEEEGVGRVLNPKVPGGLRGGGLFSVDKSIGKNKEGASTSKEVTIDQAGVQETIKKYLPKVEKCRRKSINRSSLVGTVEISWNIHEDGSSSDAQIVRSTIDNGAFKKCLTETVNKFRFDKPPVGGIVNLSYPFKFSEKLYYPDR